MNIVKGVASFIRRSSISHHGESVSVAHVQRFNPPMRNISFSDVRGDSVLDTIWKKYEDTVDEAEKRRLFQIFLKKFLDVYEKWEPVNTTEELSTTAMTSPSMEQSSDIVDTVGCSVGHPTEVILALIEDVVHLTSLITEMNNASSTQSGTPDPLRGPTFAISSEGLLLLRVLLIVVRSKYNCRTFGYHGGVQKLIGLLKAAVLQLKTIAGALSVDGEGPSMVIKERYGALQEVIVYIVSIICCFIELNLNACEVAQLYRDTSICISKNEMSIMDPKSTLKNNLSDTVLLWRLKAVISVMEAGGLNWLVELLRVIRRLNAREQRKQIPVQYLIMRALYSAISENTRAQNHLRSIGGLEVLLDGLGLPSGDDILSKIFLVSPEFRDPNLFLGALELHHLSLEVLRESVFGNLSNLQFLCENGRVHKFANRFCSPAILLQEYKNAQTELVQDDTQIATSRSGCYNDAKTCNTADDNLLAGATFPEYWKNYTSKLSQTLCSFILSPEESNSAYVEGPAGRNISSVSTVFAELSVKWILKVLLVIFTYIEAFLSADELRAHLRTFVHTLQRHALCAFRNVLASSPFLLEVFRGEGIWQLVFSDGFFYFESAFGKLPEITCSNISDNLSKPEVTTPQVEAILFVEYVATSIGSTHNMPECSALLDALEKSTYNPEVTIFLAKSMIKILKHSPEKTIASFIELKAVSRILKVACIQAEEFRGSGSTKNSAVMKAEKSKLNRFETLQRWRKSVEASVQLFATFLSTTDDAKNMVLRSSTCIDCLFNLFWEEDLRNLMLGYILDLMKAPDTFPTSVDDKAKKQLCSKFFETFNLVKEKTRDFVDISIDLLAGMRVMLLQDQAYYQALFRDGECFLHVISLLNGTHDTLNGEKLVLCVLETLTSLLANNDASKATFRSLVGRGYQTIQSLLLDYCRGQPTEQLLNALLEMLVDAKFDLKAGPLIKNEDAIILYIRVLQKSSDSLRQHGLTIFLQLLRDSISNRDSCVRAGMMDLLLDWFSQEDNDNVILKISQLIQVTGGHSISGKDIRRIFALLRSEKVGSRQQYCSLLMNSILSMLNEKGPTTFFDLIGDDSGILIRTPIQWPMSKGFTFCCWLRVETFPRYGTMGLFSFLSDHGRGCIALLAQDKLIFESICQKRYTASLNLNIVRKKWHFLCITHSHGGRFSGGSLLRCFVDGVLSASEKCRYARVHEPMTKCTIGTKILLPQSDEDNTLLSAKDVSPFHGQIGPVYMFNDAISAGQVLGINSLGPSYMYSFLDIEDPKDPSPGGVFDLKDGLAPKVVFGLNAQASSGRRLYNASALAEHAPDKGLFEATVMIGTQLCSRRLLQQIIYCVGGVSVFFPLFTQSHWYENLEENNDQTLLIPITKERLTAEVIELIASVLDENLANQQQMHLVSGFSILGYLLQSVPPQQLNLETISALKHLFNVVANCGLSDLLVNDALSYVFLNPLVWVYTLYKVQRELYMFLIQQFDNDPRLLQSLCRLPRVIDIIHLYYWDSVKCRSASGGKPLLNPVTKEVIGERPSREEIHKLRLLLLSLGEMSLRQNITQSDVRSLVAFCETSQDRACVEDVLNMLIRALSLKPLLASFVEQIQLIGGCQVFINLLQRQYEPIRLLGLQLVGRLLVGTPAEKKGLKLFNLAVGRTRFLENSRKTNVGIQQPILSAISDRLFRFPLTEHMCNALFDVLLGGASPKQVLQKQNQLERLKSRSGCHFSLPHVLPLIFKYLSKCKNGGDRVKIMASLLELLDTNPSNIEALMEHGWNAWLMASAEFEVVKSYKMSAYVQDDNEITEQSFVRAMYAVVLSHHICFVKGGWQYLEETTNFILMNFEEGGVSYHYLLRDIYEDLIRRILELSSEDNVLGTQPCRDNTLYLLRLIDELLLSEIDHKLPFPARSTELSSDLLDMDSDELGSALYEALQGGNAEKISSSLPEHEHSMTGEDAIMDEEWWHIYDYLWIILSEMSGKGTSRPLPKSSSCAGPSLGQRARGLVESLNIPAAEMAAVVVAGGLGNALGGKANKSIDKAMVLRGEKCPRIVFRLVVLYLCRASLQRASRCVQQITPLLPCLLIGDDEQSKNRLQLFIWSLLVVRSEYGMLDDGNRFHSISHLIREIVSCGKSMLATSIAGRDDPSDTGAHVREPATIHSLLQKDRIISAVSEESNYMKTVKEDRTKQLSELRSRIDESFSAEASHKEDFEDDLRNSLHDILSSDDIRRSEFQLACDEEQQIVTAKWLHMFRSMIDERGPWSANTFPNCAVRHWKLDKTEDSWRRRLKLKQNYHFDEKLCQPPANVSEKEDVEAANEIKSGSGVPIPEQMKRLLLKGIRRITDEGMLEIGDSDTESNEEKISNPKQVSDSQSEAMKDGGHMKDPIQERKETSSSLEADGGEVLMSAVCVLITPKRKLAGRLAVRRNALHFFGEFLVEGTAGSSVFRNFDSLSNSESEKLDNLEGIQKEKYIKLQTSSTSNSEKGNNVDSVYKESRNIKRHRRWDLLKIKAVHWTRHLLRYTAIEIFFSNSVPPVFLNFASQQLSKDIGNLIVATRNELLFPRGSNRDRSGVICFIDRRVAQELAETARESWRRREMTNFEYLMTLNTLAGRSYSDLTQYPVFPWVLADYSSEILDFNKSSTFRDLSKPVGALDPKRFEVFEDRYQNFDDPDIPSFYYGSHYSSSGIVLYYLLRLEPFTSLHRHLQGGKFDHADRLFQGIEGTYKNCLTNTSDVKELIPEFFYMPEFLVNSNYYHLGVRQDGEPIDDVCLPPWAKGSPEEFIYKNREALESEYVSSNLHHWIDLVFGYKQRGKPAVEAANIFYYLTYEGAVDLENMEDELQRSAIEDQIANFGQTPIQIFRKKHPRRGPPVPIAHPLHFAPASIILTSIIPSMAQPPSALLYVNVFDSSVVLVNQGLTMSVKLWVTTQLQTGGNFTFSGSQDPFFGIGYDILSSRKIGSPLAENVELGSQCFATLQTPSENFLIFCGNWEYSFQVISLADGRCVQSVRRHKDVVSAVAVSSDGSILATGSYDTTVMVWEVQDGKTHEKRARSAQSELPRKACIISETPFHVLCGHDDIITGLYVSVDLDIVISGSKDGTCMFHTLREGKYVRSLRHPSGSPLSKFVVSRHGRIVLYSDDDLNLHLYTINGKHIASSESNGRLNCVQLSACGDFLVCGGDQGVIVVRSMNSLDLVMKYSGPGKVITSLAVTSEECFLAGSKDGNLLVYSIENPQNRKNNLVRSQKSKSSLALAGLTVG